MTIPSNLIILVVVSTTGIAGGLLSPIRALLLAPLKGIPQWRVSGPASGLGSVADLVS